MMGSFITRALIMAFGYAYPAYECYKTVEKNRPEIEQLRFWCQYWILVVVLTVSEGFGDAFISWLPMYGEAKLVFYIYLWYPKTRGTTYVYDTFLKPYVAKHEVEIDRNLLELRTRAGDAVILYWQRAATYGQTRFFEILQFAASQSQPSKACPAQRRPQQQPVCQPPPIIPVARQPTASVPSQQPVTRPPPSPAKGQTQDTPKEEATAPLASPALSRTRSVPNPHIKSDSATNSSKPTEAELKQAEATRVSVSKKENPKTPPKETIIEETLRITRGRLRKTRSDSAAAPSTGTPLR